MSSHRDALRQAASFVRSHRVIAAMAVAPLLVGIGAALVAARNAPPPDITCHVLPSGIGYRCEYTHDELAGDRAGRAFIIGTGVTYILELLVVSSVRAVRAVSRLRIVRRHRPYLAVVGMAFGVGAVVTVASWMANDQDPIGNGALATVGVYVVILAILIPAWLLRTRS